jgi:hypothetical protein
MRRRLVLAGQLAGRLAEGGPEYRAASTLASIVAADLEKVVDTWVQVRVKGREHNPPPCSRHLGQVV